MELVHLARLSDDRRMLARARRINARFLAQGKTDLRHLDSEHEAVYLASGEALAAIVVFGLIDDEDRARRCFYVPIVWVSPRHRARGCYARLIGWLLDYARAKGVKTIETDVMSWNTRMVEICRAHWEHTYLRFRITL